MMTLVMRKQVQNMSSSDFNLYHSK